MDLLADENFPAPVIAALRSCGHDALSVAQMMPGAPDSRVLAAAVEGRRLLMTLDRDYGDLIFHHGHPAPTGVVLFRLTGPSPADDNLRMIESLDRLDECVGRFTTVTERPNPATHERFKTRHIEAQEICVEPWVIGNRREITVRWQINSRWWTYRQFWHCWSVAGRTGVSGRELRLRASHAPRRV